VKSKKLKQWAIVLFGGVAGVSIAAIQGNNQASPKGAISYYPPKSLDDARALAATSKITLPVVLREAVSFPRCTCRLNVLVPSDLSKQTQAAALFKVFFANKLDQKLSTFPLDGGVVVFGWAKKSDIGQGAFTAGRVLDEKAKGMSTVTLDVDADSKERTFTYSG